MIFDVTIVIVLGRQEPRPYKRANLIDKCVCSDCSTNLPFPHISLPTLGPPYSLRYNNVEINNPTAATKCSGERKSHTSLTLNQKTKMIKPSEERHVKSRGRLKAARSLVPVSQVVNAKEKFLNKIESATPVNTRMIRKRFAGLGKVLVVWIDDQTSHNIPLGQSLIQSKALTLFSSLKAERSEEATEEKFEASRGWFMKYKERSHFCNIKV